MCSLTGKRILIIGCTSSVGEAILQESISCGGTILGTGRDEHRLSLLSSQNPGVPLFRVDLLDDRSTNQVIESINNLDGVVFSVGGPSFRPIQYENTETILDSVRSLYIGVASFVSRLILAQKLNNGASIVFISSISGVSVGANGNSSYCAGKAALSGLTKALALELSPKSIRVNSVCPGILEMPKLRDTFPETVLNNILGQYPLKRFGQPKEIAKMTCFLLSDDCTWLTGQDIIIDGGYTIR